MTFLRSQSGIANFNKFVGADILVYIEGKQIRDKSSKITYDEHFYRALLKSIYPNKKIEVKCVGNKSDVLKYALVIEEANSNSNVVIVDRDADDLICSLLAIDSIIYTDGYSWENDFWSLKLSRSTLSTLACNDGQKESLCTRINNVIEPLKCLSELDLVCHINGEALLIKNGGACGINFSFEDDQALSSGEVNRIKRKFQVLGASSCGVCTGYIDKVKAFKAKEVIQGHLWEHLILRFIQTFTTDRVSNNIIKNVAMDKFMINPLDFMESSSFNYYKTEFKKRFG